MTADPLFAIDDARRQIAGAGSAEALSELAASWRAAEGMEALLNLASALWDGGSAEDRTVAAKLLTKARIPEDAQVWATLCAWAADLDAPAALPALSAAGARRVAANPARLEDLAPWLGSANPLARAAAFGFAMNLAKQRHPAPDVAQRRLQAAAWAVRLANDPDPAPRRAAADYLVSLSKHDAGAVAALIENGAAPPRALLARLKGGVRP